MFQLFTDETLEVIKFAQKEANKRGDSFLGSEHLLLGLIKKGGGITKEVLTLFKIDFQTVIDAIENNNQSNIEKEPKLLKGDIVSFMKLQVFYILLKMRHYIST